MTELPIIVNTNEVTVGGVVDQVELQLSIGAQGERGSRIFSGNVSPLTLPVDSPYFAGYTEFIPGDMYIERSISVLALWEWKSQPGGYTWVETATISTGEGGGGFLDADLEAIAALTGTNGLLRKTATNTWVLDTNSYLTSNQLITLSGDVSGTGTTSISTTVADDSHSHTSSTISALDAGDTTTGTFNIARIPTGTTGTTVSLGNHTHSGYQAADGDLTAISALTGTGYLKRTGADTWTLDTPATATWGSITGTLSNQTDLNNALNAKQAADNDLTAIAALAGTSGFLKKTATDTWTLDTSTYLTANQTITLSGDASGSGTTAITVTVADDSHAHTSSTISALDASDTTTGKFNIARIPTGSTGTTVSLGNHTHSYQPVDADLTAIAGLAGTSGFLKKTATDTWALDTNTYLTGNQTITLSGVVTGSGTTAITTSFATSPAFTGTPTAPTAAVDTNTTQIATTAYVIGQGYLKSSTASSTYAPSTLSTSAQTASYTAVLSDSGKIVEIASASANTFTIPPNSSVAFPVGTQITVVQTDTGQTTITAGSGVTINATPGLKLRDRWSSATIIKRATDTWLAVGDLSA